MIPYSYEYNSIPYGSEPTIYVSDLLMFRDRDQYVTLVEHDTGESKEIYVDGYESWKDVEYATVVTWDIEDGKLKIDYRNPS